MVTSLIQAPIFFAENGYQNLNSFLEKYSPSGIFIIVDSNTHALCLPHLMPLLETTCIIEIIEMEPGEDHKHIETCTGIWNVLSELGADRKSLVINLGGGVVTDLGGFVASAFKRGISFINIPTTLLAMVDASVGGKTGVDLGNLKNQIGVISQPEMIIIDPIFLNTLTGSEMKSGLAEILKHGLIANRSYWEKAINLKELHLEDLQDLIVGSIDIKSHIVTQDPKEENLRKTLNFGHTFGHAIESYFLTHPHKPRLLHGEAVAAGMIIALFISYKLTGFPKEEFNRITENLLELYPASDIQQEDYNEIMNLLKFDKKNSHGNINFVLLEEIGVPKIDCKVPQDLLIESLQFYNKLKTR